MTLSDEQAIELHSRLQRAFLKSNTRDVEAAVGMADTALKTVAKYLADPEADEAS